MSFRVVPLGIIALLLMAFSAGHENDPNHAWFGKQRRADGISCCEIADGNRVDDADWKIDSDGHYVVRLNGQWTPVPDKAVINPKDRPIDYAVVWVYGGAIECFMAGAGS